MQWKAGVQLLAVASLLFTGCNRHVFNAEGKVSSEGSGLGTWSKTPEGCTRDPFDARPVETTNAIASFFWEDPAGKDARLQRNFGRDAPDQPNRMDVMRDHGGFAVRLQTVKTAGTLLDRSNCLKLDVETHEQPAAYANGRPALAGHIVLDCRAAESRITADFSFQRCEY